jgi:pimeloyl-ACP methyl ester carboxylesterase
MKNLPAAGAPVKKLSRFRRWQYWVRLLGFTILLFTILFITGYAWLTAKAAIRPNHHAVCCATPADFGASYEDVSLQAADGARLAGWYIPSQNGAAVILLHGYGGDRRGTLNEARMLHAHGYGVLLYDQRASGESQGETLSWGWRDVHDVQAALDYLGARMIAPHANLQPGRVGIMGCSTGAEIALGAAALCSLNNPSCDIKAVIADGPYYATTSDSWPPYEFTDWLGWPIYPLFIGFMQQRSGASAPMSLRQAAASIAPRPLLLIAAGQVGYEQLRTREYYKAAGDPKELWIIDGVDHCAGPHAQPAAYEARMIDFFDRGLLSQ